MQAAQLYHAKPAYQPVAMQSACAMSSAKQKLKNAAHKIMPH